MIFERFVIASYLRLFLPIFVGLELFFIMLESLKYGDDLPSSANELILFVLYDAIYAAGYILPIALVLSAVACYISLLKSNYFSTLLSLGYSRVAILRPILYTMLFFVLAQMGINATSLAYAQESAEVIVYGSSALNTRHEVFLKHENKYIYMDKIAPIFPAGARAEGIKVFEIKDGTNLASYYQAKNAYYTDERWILKDSLEVKLLENPALGKKASATAKVGDVELLAGFRPKILDAIANDKPVVSIMDGIEALKIAIAQNNPTQKLRAALYTLVVVPFFVPLVLIIIAFFIPPLARYGNLTMLAVKCIIIALSAWGLMFSLGEMGSAGLFNPELGILLPFFALFGVAMFFRARLNAQR